MMPRSAKGQFVLVTVGLAALCGAARAGDDDFEFADGLSRRGYPDLANEVYQSLLNDPKSSPSRKAEGQLGIATLVYGEARQMAAERNDKRRKPMKEVLAKFDDADGAFAKFIEANPSHARTLEAKLSRGKLLQDKAEYVKVAIQNDWLGQGESASALTKQVADWFDTAIQLFDAAQKKAEDDKKKLKEAGKDSGPEWEDAYDRMSLVWLYRLAALYGKGAALPKGDAGRDVALKQCIKEGSDDYQWEFGETVRGLWAVHYAALASAELDAAADAFNMLKTAASFTAEKDASPSIQDITFQSYRELGRVCLVFGRRGKDDWPANALRLFEGLPKAWPAWDKHPEGQRAGLVWAELIERAGQFDKAFTKVQQIARAAEETNSPTRSEALRALEKMIRRGGGIDGGDPKQLWKVAMNGWRDGDAAGALRGFQAVISACDSPEDLEQYEWPAWDYVGRCYYQLGRFYESFLAFEQIELAWRKDKNNEKLNSLTDETGWSRLGALDALLRQTKDPADKAAFDQAQKDFRNDHPNSIHNQANDVAEAEKLIRDAEQASADPQAYRVALQAAYDACAKVPQTSKSYDLIRAKMVRLIQKIGTADPAAFDAAKLGEAVTAAEAWMSTRRPDDTNSTVIQGRAQGRVICVTIALAARADRADALKRAKQPAEAAKAYQELLTALDQYGADFKASASTPVAGQSRLDNWRAEGLIGVGRVDDADQLVGKLIESAPDSRNNVYLSALMGAALERRAQEQLGKGDTNGAKLLSIRCARRREWVLENSKLKDGSPAPRNPEVIRTIAENYANGGDFKKAEELYAEAQRMFEALADAAQNPETRTAYLGKAKSCRIKLIDLLVMQEKFDAAIPQLEKEIAKDPRDREAFLKRTQTTDNISAGEFKKLIEKSDVNKTLLDTLSKAYMKAPSKERLFGVVNLCALLNLTLPPEEHHRAEYIEFALRRAEAYVLLAAYTRLPEHYKAAASAIRNAIIIPGYLEPYEQELPGAKKRAESILQLAEEGMKKVGAK